MSVSLRQHFWKTKMCPLFLENKCKEGDKCDYAHSVNDLRTIPDLRRTKLCFKLLKGETCMNSNCNFAHSQNELKSAQNLFAYKSSMCKFIGTNNCLNGSTCRFAHSVEELRISKADEFANEKSGINMEKTINNKNNNNNDDDNNIDVSIIKNKKKIFVCNIDKNNNCNANSIFRSSQNKHYCLDSGNINGINTKHMNNEKILSNINNNIIKNILDTDDSRKKNNNNITNYNTRSNAEKYAIKINKNNINIYNDKHSVLKLDSKACNNNKNNFENYDSKINNNNNNNNRNRLNHNRNRTHNNNRMHNNKQKRKSNSHLSHHNDNRDSFVSNSESNMVFANYEITRNRKIFSNETNYNNIEMDERKGIEANTEKTFENIQMDLYCERSNSSCSEDSIRKEKYMNELKEDTCKQNESIETTPKEMSPKKDICNDEHVVYENKYNASTESKNIQMHSSTEAAAAVPAYTPYYIPAVPVQEPMIPQYNYNYMNNFVMNRMMNPEFKMQNNPMQYMTPYIMPHPMNYYPANMNHPVPYFPYAPIDASFYQPMIPVEQKNVNVYESKETQQEEIVESPKKINKAKKYIDLKHPVSHIRTLQKEDIDDEESLLSQGENDIDNMTCILEVYKNHIIKATDNRNGNSLENTSDIRCSSVRNPFGQMPNKSIQLDSMDDENMNDIEEKLRRFDINYKNRQEQNDSSNVIFKEQSRIITKEMHKKNVETDEEDETKKQNNRCSVYSYLHHGTIHQEKGQMNNDSSTYGKNYYPFVPQMNLNNQNAFYNAYYDYFNNMNNELYKF